MSNIRQGFTLIELSIVLVIIGLIVGSVLAGRDLINAATLRAQIAQIDKYNAAVNTFRTKYNCLPGDCAKASTFGFVARGSFAGEGDGNGIIEGIYANAPGSNSGVYQGGGETGVFWRDLSNANLIDASGITGPVADDAPNGSVTGSGLNQYLPKAKIGNGNYVYVYSGVSDAGGAVSPNGYNYFGILQVTSLNGGGGGLLESNPGFSVQQAYNIDAKVDNGMPQTGSVTIAFVAHSYIAWADGTPAGNYYAIPETNAEAASGTSCQDNGNVGGVSKHYSTQVNGGRGINCALSFSFQ